MNFHCTPLINNKGITLIVVVAASSHLFLPIKELSRANACANLVYFVDVKNLFDPLLVFEL